MATKDVRTTGRKPNPGSAENRINLACTPEEKKAVLTLQKVHQVPFLVDVLRMRSLNECVEEYRKLRELLSEDDAEEEDEAEPATSASEG
jgi:hypothetical protein